MNKRLISVVLIFILLFAILSGCRSGDDNDNSREQGSGSGQGEGEQPSIYDEYKYLPLNGFFLLDKGELNSLDGFTTHDNNFYYIFTEYSENPIPQEQAENPDEWFPFIPSVQIKGIDHLGETIMHITLDEDFLLYNVSVIGFGINEDSEFIIITRSRDFETDQGFIYYERYSLAGALLQREEMLHIDIMWAIMGVYFDTSGCIAIVGATVSDYSMQASYYVHLWDGDLNYLRRISTSSDSFAFDNKGAFFHLVFDDILTLNHVDLATGDSLNEYPLSFYYTIDSIFNAEENSRFDCYIITDQHLYGVEFDTDEPELMLDFHESNINLEYNAFIIILSDGSIAISQSKSDYSTMMWQPIKYEFTVLTPVLRADIGDIVEVVLAAFGELGPIDTNLVTEYNRNNTGHQIVLRNYWEPDDDGIKQAVERLHYDILRGNAPDIISLGDFDNPDYAELNGSLIAQGYLADLYPLLDADPVLGREDFFPLVLKGYEDSSGRLPIIGNRLIISTMLSVDHSIKQEIWTVDSFLTLMEDNIASGMKEPLGSRVTGTDFLFQMLELIGDTFVDFDKGESYFNSDNFIRLLELTKAIPQAPPPDSWHDINFQGLTTGKQVIDLARIIFLNGWVVGENDYGLPDSVVLFDFEFIGIPSASCGVHIAEMPEIYGIFDKGDNIEAAWQFVREILLPGATFQEYVSIRIDSFESMLTSSPLSIAEQDSLRDILHSATVQKPLSGTIMMIIEEEITQFFRGTRSAADTARVIQSRASIYISERS